MMLLTTPQLAVQLLFLSQNHTSATPSIRMVVVVITIIGIGSILLGCWKMFLRLPYFFYGEGRSEALRELPILDAGLPKVVIGRRGNSIILSFCATCCEA